MLCENCGHINADKAKTCESCGNPLHDDDGDGKYMQKRRALTIIAVVASLLLIMIVLLNAVVIPENDDELLVKYGSHEFKETVIANIEASTSSNVPSVSQVVKELSNRGFKGYSLSSNYDMDGKALDDREIDLSDNKKYPLYNVAYVTPEGDVWVVYICDGKYMANPLFLYESAKTSYLLTEDDYVTSYSSNIGLFIRSVPDESELIVKKVERIDSKTLDSLDEKGIEAL